MMPLIAQIRETVDCAVAAQQVPYRFPDFASAVELARRQTRAAGKAALIAVGWSSALTASKLSLPATWLSRAI